MGGQAIGEEADVESSSADTVATEEGYRPVFFDPRGLKNLLMVDEMESLCPIMDMQVPYFACFRFSMDAGNPPVSSSQERFVLSVANETVCAARSKHAETRRTMLSRVPWLIGLGMSRSRTTAATSGAQGLVCELGYTWTRWGVNVCSAALQASNLLSEEIPQIYTVCGRGSRSSLRILRPGLAITELAVWQLPGQPTAVWTLKRSQADELDALIVVSFANATLVRSTITSNWLDAISLEVVSDTLPRSK